MLEFDVDKSMSLDIDEFVTLMTAGDELSFVSAENKSTFFKLKRARRLNCADFMKMISAMSTSIVPSFFKERWVGYRKNLPSSVFKVQGDPLTMLWKDISPPAGQAAEDIRKVPS